MIERMSFACRVLLCATFSLGATASPTFAAVAPQPVDAHKDLAVPSGETPPETPATPPRAIQFAPDRGQLLYENHCMGCHESRLHIRERRKVRSRDELGQWVARWANELKLNWRGEDINDVAEYLERHYYRFERGQPPIRMPRSEFPRSRVPAHLQDSSP